MRTHLLQGRILYICVALNLAVLVAVALAAGKLAAVGALVYSSIGWALFAIRPSSPLHNIDLFPLTGWKRVVSAVVCAATILTAVLPMSLSPIWNGEIPQHRNQYEVIADAFIHGQITVYDDEDTTALQKLENPYDPEQREGIDYHWDHAFYNGNYYVYFGVVPAVLVFVPYQLVTGHSLTTYHATQLFVALFIVALFILIAVLMRSFSLRLSFVLYLLLAVTSSFICVLCSMMTPAMYCTAITSGLCFEAWSLVCYFGAVYLLEGKKSQVPVAFLGGLFGAFVFGCRPALGLMNLIAVPLLFHYLRGKERSMRTVGTVALVVLPYIAVLGMLFAYNYARFQNPLDFGAAYQLTETDIAAYRKTVQSEGPLRYLAYLKENFFRLPDYRKKFPYLVFGGVFFNYPILLFVFTMLRPSAIARMRKKGFVAVVAILALLPIVLTVIDAAWSPVLYERYRMDVYFPMALLLCLATPLLVGPDPSERSRHWMSSVVCALCLFTLGMCFLLFCTSYDKNWAAYDPSMLEPVVTALKLGR